MRPRHERLWFKGLDQWHDGRLEDSVVTIRKAIAAAGDANVPEYQQSLGCILHKLGREAETRDAFHEALRVACAHAGPDAETVTTARYFLGETHLVDGHPEEALAVVAPSIGVGARGEPLLRSIRALALYDLERDEEAVEEARAAIAGATSDEQREELEELLAHVLGGEITEGM